MEGKVAEYNAYYTEHDNLLINQTKVCSIWLFQFIIAFTKLTCWSLVVTIGEIHKTPYISEIAWNQSELAS